MNTILDIHSNLPLVIVLVIIVAALWLLVRWIQRKPYDRGSSILMMVFTRLLEIQMLFGLIYLIWNGIEYDEWPSKSFAHLAVMFVVVSIGHLPQRWQNAPDSVRYRNNFLVLIGSLVLGFVGVSFVAN